MVKKWELFYKIEEYVAGFLLSGATLVIFVAAISRSFDHPLNWSLDIALFLFAWSVFFSADVAMRKGNLVNVEFIIKRFSPSAQRIIGIAVYVIILAFLVTLVIFGFYLSYATRARAFQGIPQFSYTWVTLSVPVAGILQIINCIRIIRALLRRDERVIPHMQIDQDGEAL